MMRLVLFAVVVFSIQAGVAALLYHNDKPVVLASSVDAPSFR